MQFVIIAHKDYHVYNRIMINLLTWLSRKRFPYEPLITVEISKSRLLHNLNEFRKIAPCGNIAPVLKSNAYGHGLLEIAEILENNSKCNPQNKIPFFVVDSYFEAVALRSHGIRTPLLIIGYTRKETILSSKLQNISYTISSLEQLKQIESTNKHISIHLKIDTGMHRQGILEEEIEQVSEILFNNPAIILHGICSHLCDSDNLDTSFTEGQIHIWNRITKFFKNEFSSLKYLHLSATEGHKFTDDIDANVSRLGLGLYGLADGNVFSPKLDLKPIMELKTIITSIKKIKHDDTVGYGNTFKTDHDMTIATIPVGYYEGLDRRLSNNGCVDVGDEHIICPIIGRVSMNITSIDISKVDNVKIGTPVTVISNNSSHENSIRAIALRITTIPYEVVVNIPESLKRVVIT